MRCRGRPAVPPPPRRHPLLLRFVRFRFIPLRTSTPLLSLLLLLHHLTNRHTGVCSSFFLLVPPPTAIGILRSFRRQHHDDSFSSRSQQQLLLLLRQARGDDDGNENTTRDDGIKNGATTTAAAVLAIASAATASPLLSHNNNNEVANHGNNTNGSTTTNTTTNNSKVSKVRRKPAFPLEAYSRHLMMEEDNLEHHFVSFVDQSILRQYSQSVRLVEPRTYARPDPFRIQNQHTLPCIDDVAEPPSPYTPLALFFAWNGIPARLVIAGIAYSIFPFIVSFLSQFSVDLVALAALVSDFLPGLAIVLGTYFSLTITILYDRFAKLQEVVNEEASTLALTCRSVMDSFANDDDVETRIDAVQAVADQVRTMIFDNRGKETLGVIYNDPYARLLQLVLQHQATTTARRQMDPQLRSSIETLMTLRSRRMTFESMALAPTHFDVMTFLCGMLLVGFSLGTVAEAQTNGVPTELAKILFASLVVCYTLFYEMSFDLNRPFSGIYQIRRAGAAMHFLQIKHWISNDPMLASAVDFEEVLDQTTATAATTTTTTQQPPGCDGDCERQKAQTWYN
jgi:Protein of unknown function (DUF4239)